MMLKTPLFLLFPFAFCPLLFAFCFCLGLVQGKHRLGGRQKQGVAAATGEKLDLLVALPLVDLKVKRQLAVDRLHFGLGGSIGLRG